MRILWAAVLAVAVAGCAGAPERPAPAPGSAEVPAGETPPDRAGKKLIKVPARSMCDCRVVQRQALVRDTGRVVGADSASDLVVWDAVEDIFVRDAVNAMSAGEPMPVILDYVRDFKEGRRPLAGCIKDCECSGPFQVHFGVKRNDLGLDGTHRVLLLHPSDLLLAPDSRVVVYPDGNHKVHGELYARGHEPGDRPDLGC